MTNEALKDLIGLRIKRIITDSAEVTIFTHEGRSFRMYHMQDCCESVEFREALGAPLQLLEDLVVTDATHQEGAETPAGADANVSSDDSHTWTVYTIQCGPFATRFVWFGTSNGYYSESVYFSEF